MYPVVPERNDGIVPGSPGTDAIAQGKKSDDRAVDTGV